MISDNFYPEAYSLNNGEISLTADVLTLPGSIADNMLPYYIGYISFEKMPTHWKFNTAEIVDDNTVSVTAITQNYGWGFMYHWNDIDGSNIALMRPCLIADVSGTKTDLSGAGYSHHFVNHGIVASANFANKFRLFFNYIAMPTTWLTDDDSCIYSKWPGHYCEALTVNVTLTWEQIKDFLDNEGTITLTGLSYNTTQNTVTFKASDFGEETHTAKLVSEQSTGYTVFIQLTNMTAYGWQAYVQGDNTKTNSRFTPFFAMDIKGNGGTVADQKALVCPNDLAYTSGHSLQITFDGTASDQQKMIGIGYSSSDRSVAGNSYMGNLAFLDGLTQQDFRERGYNERTYYWYADGGIISGKYIVNGSNSLTCGVYVPMEIEDMRRIASFIMNKIETNVTGSATISDFTDASRGYTTDFSTALFDKSTSDPLDGGTRVYKNFVDMADKLCLWQFPYTDMSVNEFTEDQIPEWTPEPGTDEDGDGDTILPPSISGIGDLSGFVTMYALKDDQLSNLGNTLWSSFTDSNFWNSVSVVLSNTTSIDPSTILNYIVSIRLFPFNLATVEGASAELPEIFFGRGLVGLLLDPTLISRVYILNKCVTRIDGGVLDVPAKYGDFRDMEPCAKMILHVPFAGSCEINPSQVVGKHLALSYSIDYCTGAFMAQCFVGGDGLSMSYPVATLYGQLGATVQLSASNEMESLQCLAGATLGLATGAMNGIAGAISGAVGVATSLSNNRAVPHATGKSAGFSSFFEPRVPYIEIIYDKYYVPDNYAHVHGYACNTTSKIGDLHGYTVCRNVDTTGLTCETDERLSIKRILESGFFVD